MSTTSQPLIVSNDRPPVPRGAGRVVTLGLLAAAAVAMQLLEAPLPRPLPWLKPGLANSTSLVALILFDLPAALVLVTVRQVGSHLLMGTILAPAFLLGLAGAAAAAAVMALALRLSPRVGILGVSVLGAMANNAGQLTGAALILGHAGVWYQLPLMLTVSLPAGLLIGGLTHVMLDRMRGLPAGSQ